MRIIILTLNSFAVVTGLFFQTGPSSRSVVGPKASTPLTDRISILSPFFVNGHVNYFAKTDTYSSSCSLEHVPFFSRKQSDYGFHEVWKRQRGHSLHPTSFWTKVFHARGGGDGVSETDEKDASIDDELSPGGNVDEMQELRRRWSTVPAVPSIEWPFDIDVSQQNNDHGLDQEKEKTKAIIILDGFSPYHGVYLAQAAHHIYGCAVIHTLSDFMTRYLYQVENQTDHLSARLPDLDDADDVEAWKSLIPSSLEICGIYCESDSGLEDAERLGVALGLYPRYHDGINQGRRNKFLMNQIVSDVGGLEVVKQKSCSTLQEAEGFARDLGLEEDPKESSLIVVKPLRGVASDDVHLCSSLPSLRKAFNKIYHSPIFGSPTSSKHEHVLVQEFATGVEYAIDIVCRDGERKVAALWRYDKRAVNGAPFVYFATHLVPAAGDDGSPRENEVEQEVCEYAFNALDALGIRWGLSHVECIAETIPSPSAGVEGEGRKIRVRLVEVNCRQHNTDFRPLTNAVIGYNALDIVLAAYLGDRDSSIPKNEEKTFRHRPLKWDEIPTLPSTLAFGAIVHFVSFVDGKISKIRHDVLEDMEELDSVMDMHVYPQFLEVGNEIKRTVDIRSDTGWAHLLNDDEEQFHSDYQRLIELMKEMFEVE